MVGRLRTRPRGQPRRRRGDGRGGIDISDEYPKPWTDEIVQAADVVVTMGCGDACPVFPGRRYEEWVLDDPAGQELDDVRPIRDDIEERVRRLLTDLNVPNHTRTKSPAVAADPAPSGQRPTSRARIGRVFRSIIEWFRAGYPDEAPRTGHSPLLALNGPIALTPGQTAQIVSDWVTGLPTRSMSASRSPKSPTSCPPRRRYAQSLAHCTQAHHPSDSAL